MLVKEQNCAADCVVANGLQLEPVFQNYKNMDLMKTCSSDKSRVRLVCSDANLEQRCSCAGHLRPRDDGSRRRQESTHAKGQNPAAEWQLETRKKMDPTHMTLAQSKNKLSTSHLRPVTTPKQHSIDSCRRQSCCRATSCDHREKQRAMTASTECVAGSKNQRELGQLAATSERPHSADFGKRHRLTCAREGELRRHGRKSNESTRSNRAAAVKASM